jgi:hypothetical protein
VETFSYKPALLGARCDVSLDARGARARRGNREQAVKFADVTAVRFVQIAMRTSSTSLVLIHRDGKFAINYGGLSREAAHSEEAKGFVGACVAILEAYAAARPGAEVLLGGGPALRMTMAGMGVVMAVLGALLALIPLGQSGVDGEGLVVIVMAGLIALGGVGLAVRYNPFKPLPAVKADALADLLRQYLREAGCPPDQMSRSGA